MDFMGMRASDMFDIDMGPDGLGPDVWDDAAYPTRGSPGLQERESAYEWCNNNQYLVPTGIYGDEGHDPSRYQPFGVLDFRQGQDAPMDYYSMPHAYAMEGDGRLRDIVPMEEHRRRRDVPDWRSPPLHSRWNHRTYQENPFLDSYEEAAAARLGPIRREPIWGHPHGGDFGFHGNAGSGTPFSGARRDFSHNYYIDGDDYEQDSHLADVLDHWNVRPRALQDDFDRMREDPLDFPMTISDTSKIC